LGKDYLMAWLDGDDPRQWDVTNSVVYSSGFEIDPRGARREFLQSATIRKWLDAHRVPITPEVIGQMPLGDTVGDWNLHSHTLQSPRGGFLDIEVTKVRFED